MADMKLYLEYMSEYIDEMKSELDKYREEYRVYDEAAKEGVFKDGYYLRDHLQTPFVTPKLSKSKIQNDLIDFTAAFIDNHNKELGTSGPVYMFTFGDKEINTLYSIFGIKDNQQLLDMYNEMVKDTYYGNISKFITGWIEHAPHKLLLTAILVDALQNSYNDIIECCEYLWAFCEYPIVYRMFWNIGVKEEVMDYTIEHLGNKFTIKSKGMNNLQELLKYDSHTSVVAHQEYLKTGADNTYIDFMYRLRNQLKNRFLNIANAYYENDKENASQHSKDSQFDDGSLADMEGYTTTISQTVETTVSKFMIGGINASIVKTVAEGSQVDKDNLAGYINQIWHTKNNRIPKMIENIITIYFTENPSNSKLISSEFVDFGLALYRSIGTSKDPLYSEIKNILNYWMNDIINIRDYYQRPATIINYTRAIFNYVIFMINHYN